jgi:ribosome-binding protein aMBF1 (putative translation factor)
LGFAYRHISVKFTPKTRKPSQPKPLPASVKTMADWISMKLHEKGMASFHFAAEMGIATAVVNAWKDGLTRPKASQVREMVSLLGVHRGIQALRHD